jgi:hypothetical protein
MARHLVLAHGGDDAECAARRAAWAAFFRLLERTDPADPQANDRRQGERFLIYRLTGGGAGDWPALYAHACARIQAQLEAAADLVVIVDAVDLSQLNPLLTGVWSGFVARLVLAHPEVQWVFSLVSGERAYEFTRSFGLARLFEPAPDPLFDPAGLRDTIRGIARGAKNTGDDPSHLPVRAHTALALDEERAYCLLHALTAYRFGYRVAAVHSGRAADQLLGPGSAFRPALTFEDLYISFPDRSYRPSHHLSRYADRSDIWPALDGAPLRVVVTSGHDQTRVRQSSSIEEFVNQARAKGSLVPPAVSKPHAGMFSLWKHSQLPGDAPGFVRPAGSSAAAAEGGDHSSPGQLMMVAESLLERAHDLLAETRSVADAVRGAVLATDALELLGNRTPTLALEALRLKHCFEVHAECHFVGVEHHANLAGRLEEVKREVIEIAQWSDPNRRDVVEANALLAISTDLARVFGEHGRFDEELACVQQGLRLHAFLRLSGGPFVWAVQPVRLLIRYLLFCLRSPIHFLFALTVWIFICSVLYGFAAYWGQPLWATAIPCSLQDAVTTFFSFGPPHHPQVCDVPLGKCWPAAIVTTCTIVLGFAHLGIFVSYLYSVLMRR